MAHTYNVKSIVSYFNLCISCIQICLLWRRAVDDKDYKRLFCLVVESNLSFKIAKEAATSLRKVIQGKTGKGDS